MDINEMKKEKDRVDLYWQECIVRSEKDKHRKMQRAFCEKYAELKVGQPVKVKRFKTEKTVKNCYVWAAHVDVKNGVVEFSYQIFKKNHKNRHTEVHLIEMDEIIPV